MVFKHYLVFERNLEDAPGVIDPRIVNRPRPNQIRFHEVVGAAAARCRAVFPLLVRSRPIDDSWVQADEIAPSRRKNELYRRFVVVGVVVVIKVIDRDHVRLC